MDNYGRYEPAYAGIPRLCERIHERSEWNKKERSDSLFLARGTFF